jgi:hypothetical protein
MPPNSNNNKKFHLKNENLFFELCRKAKTGNKLYNYIILNNFLTTFKELPSIGLFLCHKKIPSSMEQRAFKNANNYLNTNIYSYLETSGVHGSSLYSNVVLFCTAVLIRHLWQFKTADFLHRCLICAILLHYFYQNLCNHSMTKNKTDRQEKPKKSPRLPPAETRCQCYKTFSLRLTR